MNGAGHLDESLRTTELRNLVGRIQAGDRKAANELVNCSALRLEELAHKMLRHFPSVNRWEQTGDVLQNALQRLLRTLGDVCPDSVPGFFRLAAQSIRRELLDLTKHYRGPLNDAANHESVADPVGLAGQPTVTRQELHNLDRWTAFHEAVGRLPDEEREVFEMVFYEGLAKEEVARVLGVEARTVRRRWNRAKRRLTDELGDDIPT
jgi:RNA polymerase sigma-70 factor (ECF subfamily)